MPTTEAMVKECIIALKDRTGSSRQAIKKWILAKYKKVRCNAVSAIIFATGSSWQSQLPASALLAATARAHHPIGCRHPSSAPVPGSSADCRCNSTAGDRHQAALRRTWQVHFRQGQGLLQGLAGGQEGPEEEEGAQEEEGTQEEEGGQEEEVRHALYISLRDSTSHLAKNIIFYTFSIRRATKKKTTKKKSTKKPDKKKTTKKKKSTKKKK